MSSEREKAKEAAQKLILKGQYRKGLEQLLKLSETETTDPWLFSKMADLSVRIGQVNQAVGFYQKSVQIYRDTGFFQKAVSVCKQILKIQPHSVSTKVVLARTYMDMEMFGEGKKYLTEALQVYEASEDLQHMKDVLECMLETDKNDAAVRIKLADTYGRLGLHSEREEILRVGLRETLSEDGLSKTALTHALQKTDAVAEGWSENKNPKDVTVLTLYKEAYAYYKLGLREKAALLLCDLLDLDPSHKMAKDLWNQMTEAEQEQALAVFKPEFDVDEEL